ncbi:hypothetical protein L1987_80404 [Smallanthus sonchifolius]|uniref:Uncharacterized protein n=1 Tax=Smallanthus sonchifolius TaxID=185202 RepID=A0ACB8YMM0_9ASTR|nr:hypothetical protein L1987_80404 [Smallanthus sonchifolius]
MDSLLLLIIFVASILCFLIFRRRLEPLGNKPPEAAGSWPIIGHLHLLAGPQVPHKLLGSMADKFGIIFTIKLGVHRVLVVSSSEMAKECLTTNDRVFASRPKAMATELMGYNYANFGLAPYGPYWRQIRRLIVLELSSHHRLQMLADIRASEVKSSIIDIYRTWERNKGTSEMVMVDMKQWFGNIIVNMIVRMMFGNHFDPGKENRDQFQKAIKRFVELLGVLAPSDAIPWLRWLDLGGYEKNMKKTAKEVDVVINGWLEDHKKKMNFASPLQVDESRDQPIFMAALLSRVKEEVKEDVYGFGADEIVKATCMAIYAAAQEELEIHVGRDRNVEESDMSNLVYLQAIIKETMRLYPAAPLSVPHESTEDCIVGGYTVPKGTHLWVNIWKIHHDPQIWTDPFEFQSERFLTSHKEIDVKGRHFELMPFGSGRRICVGSSFALEAVQLILASIIHGFEFQKPSNEQIDMTESPGLNDHKASPLDLLVSPRLSPHVYGVSA